MWSLGLAKCLPSHGTRLRVSEAWTKFEEYFDIISCCPFQMPDLDPLMKHGTLVLTPYLQGMNQQSTPTSSKDAKLY